MKQFIKALNKDSSCFHYLCSSFPELSTEKFKAGIFDGPKIRKLIKDTHFIHSMDDTKSGAWSAFVLVTQIFLSNYKAANYSELVTNMLSKFNDLGCDMSIKVHYLHNHSDHFPENFGDLSEEQ